MIIGFIEDSSSAKISIYFHWAFLPIFETVSILTFRLQEVVEKF